MDIFGEFKQDKLSLSFLIIIVILGIFIRLNDFSEIAYWNDDITTIPTGLLVFHPFSLYIEVSQKWVSMYPSMAGELSSFYPGMAGQGEPILGNFIIASGCMLSGEDFSPVRDILPLFYPGRAELIGQQLINAFPYCHLPVYIFGLLFFFAISILSLKLLNKYESLFAVSFYAFYPALLQYSRWIHVDIFGYFFVVTGLIFLWKAYVSQKNKDLLLFIISFFFFGLASSVKLPNIIFFLFSILIIIDKYLIKKINENKLDLFKPIKILFFSSISYAIPLLTTLYFNPKNLMYIISRYKRTNEEFSSLTFNTDIFQTIIKFLTTINMMDIILVIFSLLIFVKLIRKKKNEKEKFILYLLSLLLFMLLFFKTLIYARVFITFSFGLIFLISLIFSEEAYSIFNILKIKKKRIFFFIFLSIYIIYSFSIALSSSPHFSTKNQIMCNISDGGCNIQLYSYSHKEIADFLNSTLKDDETFYFDSTILYYYIRPKQEFRIYEFEERFLEKNGRSPSTEERIKLFHPNNQTIRYILVVPNISRKEDVFIEDLKESYAPNHIIKFSGEDAVWVYDLENLQRK